MTTDANGPTAGSSNAASGKRTYRLDGNDFATLEEFYDVVSRTLIPQADWGRNLDAFNDILRGGFGTPAGGFILHWINADVSRTRLGYPETVRQLTLRLQHCHPTNQPYVRAERAAAEAGVGPTVFDWLVEIIQVHGPGGSEADDGVELILA